MGMLDNLDLRKGDVLVRQVGPEGEALFLVPGVDLPSADTFTTNIAQGAMAGTVEPVFVQPDVAQTHSL